MQDVPSTLCGKCQYDDQYDVNEEELSVLIIQIEFWHHPDIVDIEDDAHVDRQCQIQYDMLNVQLVFGNTDACWKEH